MLAKLVYCHNNFAEHCLTIHVILFSSVDYFTLYHNNHALLKDKYHLILNY